MNWRTCLLSTVSILGAVSLSCHGPETGALNPKIAAEFDRSGSTEGSRDTETPKSEIKAKTQESIQGRESRAEKMRYEKELIIQIGIIASFL